LAERVSPALARRFTPAGFLFPARAAERLKQGRVPSLHHPDDEARWQPKETAPALGEVLRPCVCVEPRLGGGGRPANVSHLWDTTPGLLIRPGQNAVPDQTTARQRQLTAFFSFHFAVELSLEARRQPRRLIPLGLIRGSAGGARRPSAGSRVETPALQ
jgi:hypothetical protein